MPHFQVSVPTGTHQFRKLCRCAASCGLLLLGINNLTKTFLGTSSPTLCRQAEAVDKSGLHRSLSASKLHQTDVFRGTRQKIALQATESNDVEQQSNAGVKKNDVLRVTALGSLGNSFLLEMGGQKILVNPDLDDNEEIKPEKVHELVDWVVLTSAREEFLHPRTITRMNLMKTNFVATEKVAETLSTLMVANLAVLAPGPDGRAMLEGESATDLAVLVAPGAESAPWEAPECGFMFVDLETGKTVAYEALGKYLGSGAASTRQGIPEESYEVNYLITPDLREASETVKGLVGKGAQLNGVVQLAKPSEDQEEDNILLAPLLALDRAVDKALGGVDDTPDEFREFLKKQGASLADVKLVQAFPGGGAVDLE